MLAWTLGPTGRHILDVGNVLVLFYFVAIGVSYVAITALSWVEVQRYRRRLARARRRRSVRSRLAPAITVCVPAYNEESVIVESVRSLLALRYPDHEIVVASDGSTDRTVEMLVEAFDLRRVDVVTEQPIATAPIRAVWRSLRHANLTVVDKENGGRSDALNVGVNFARTPLVCFVDADSLLEPDALLSFVRPFLDRPDRTVAAAGLIRIANGCEITRGHVHSIALGRRILPAVQTIEYLRAFAAARAGWSSINSLVIVSGAFGLFRRDVVVEVGGLEPESIGEDFELCLRIHRRMREARRPYHVAFVPDPVCWTQAPEKLGELGGQRDRWQRGLVDTLVRHRRMLFNPRYGTVGLLGLPFFVLFEFLGGFIEMAGLIAIGMSAAFGLVNPTAAVLFYLLAVGTGLFLSLSALLLEDVVFGTFPRWRDFARLVAWSLLENLGYRQAMTAYRVRGFVRYLRRDNSWGQIERGSFAES